MRDPEGGPTKLSRMHRRYPYGPLHLRLITPIVAIAAGTILAISSAGGLGNGDSTVLFVACLAVVVIGMIAIPIMRWMAKRGL